MRYADLMIEAATQSFIRAYHGTTHDFDSFRSRAIGRGEGFQAFGYGLYFAENYEVARFYADKLGADKPPEDQHAEVIYEVNITASPDMFLDWDKRLTEQSEYVQKALGDDLYQDNEPMLNGKTFWDALPAARPGSMLKVVARRMYMEANGDLDMFEKALRQRSAQATDAAKADVEQIIAFVRQAERSTARIIKRGYGMHFLDSLRDQTGSSKAASQWLNGRGIRGIIYLDEGSRGEEVVLGTHNYVVFNARYVKVVGKTYPRMN